MDSDSLPIVRAVLPNGLTVLLSSHHMDEVEEICDNVTIMKRGAVAFHGSIADLRAMAPDPGHLLDTGDNALALRIAAAHGVAVTDDEAGALIVSGPTRTVSAYVADIVAAGIQLRQFTPTQTPLEALFFMLTDTGVEAVR